MAAIQPLICTFLTDAILDPSALFPANLFGSTFSATPPAGVEFVQRFRYRGLRESAKWNTFLNGQDSDTQQLTTYLQQAADTLQAETVGYISTYTGLVAVLAARLTEHQLQQGS